MPSWNRTSWIYFLSFAAWGAGFGVLMELLVGDMGVLIALATLIFLLLLASQAPHAFWYGREEAQQIRANNARSQNEWASKSHISITISCEKAALTRIDAIRIIHVVRGWIMATPSPTADDLPDQGQWSEITPGCGDAPVQLSFFYRPAMVPPSDREIDRVVGAFEAGFE